MKTYYKRKKLEEDTKYELRKLKDFMEENKSYEIVKLMIVKLKPLMEMYGLQDSER